MRLSEIWDPSMYRSGDESNPQSPHYDGREVDPDSEEYPTQFEWYFYDDQGNETVAVVAGTITVVTEYHDYIPSRRRRYHEDDDDDGPEASGVGVEEIVVKQVKIGDQVMTGQQALQHFGQKQWDDAKSEFIESAADGIVAKFNKPKVTNWQMETRIVFK
jgi:hypothetical protein